MKKMTKMKNQITIEQLGIMIPLEFDMTELIRNHAKHYMFRNGKEYICSNCGCIALDDYYHCPKCHVELNPKIIRSNTNYEKLNKEFWVIKLQKLSDRIVERWFIATQKINRQSLRFETWYEEVERKTIMNGHTNIIRKGYYPNPKEWQFGYYMDSYMGKAPRKKIELYPLRMDEWLKDTELRYTTIGNYIDIESERKISGYGVPSYWLFNYLAFAAKYPWIELLFKAGLKKLWLDVLQSSGATIDMRIFRPSIIKKYRSQLTQIDAGYTQFYAIHHFKKNKFVYDLELIKSIKDTVEVADLVKATKITGMSIAKIKRYMDEVVGKSTREYFDYLDMTVKIYKSEFTEQMAFPKDLIKAHDDAVKKFNAIKHELDNQEYKKRLDQLKKFKYRNQHLAIVVPMKLEEILFEGMKLNHCVGSYIDQVKAGKRTILFIRRTDDMEKPFFTIEYSGDRIIQCRGNDNDDAPAEIKEFTDEWLKWLKKRNQRKGATVELSTAA